MWALESITTNKASGGDRIPVELFQILKDDAVKVLHSICQQIWITQQWPQDWKRSVFITIPKKGNAKECSNYRTKTTAQLHSRTIAWRIPWTEEPGRLQSMGSQAVRHDWATNILLCLFMALRYCFLWRMSLEAFLLTLWVRWQDEGWKPSVKTQCCWDHRSSPARSILRSWGLTVAVETERQSF